MNLRYLLLFALLLGGSQAALAEYPMESRFALQTQAFPGELGFWEATGGDKPSGEPASPSDGPAKPANDQPREPGGLDNAADAEADALQDALARITSLEIKVDRHEKQLTTLLTGNAELLTSVKKLELMTEKAMSALLESKSGSQGKLYGVVEQKCDNPDCQCDPCQCVGRAVVCREDNVSHLTVPHKQGVVSHPVRAVETYTVDPGTTNRQVLEPQVVRQANPITSQATSQPVTGVVSAQAGGYTMFAAPVTHGNQVVMYPTHQVRGFQQQVRSATPQQRRGLFGRIFNTRSSGSATMSSGSCYINAAGQRVCN